MFALHMLDFTFEETILAVNHDFSKAVNFGCFFLREDLVAFYADCVVVVAADVICCHYGAVVVERGHAYWYNNRVKSRLLITNEVHERSSERVRARSA